MTHPHDTLPTKVLDILAWLTRDELDLLAQLAREVPAGGHILEVGCCYGGSTATLLSNSHPDVRVTVVDDFSWSPMPEVPSTAANLAANLERAGCDLGRLTVVEGDSREYGASYEAGSITLLFLDGGHSYEYVHKDLCNFGPWAQTIALHDYTNPFWPDIERAVHEYLGGPYGAHLHLAEQADTLAVLRHEPKE